MDGRQRGCVDLAQRASLPVKNLNCSPGICSVCRTQIAPEFKRFWESKPVKTNVQIVGFAERSLAAAAHDILNIWGGIQASSENAQRLDQLAHAAAAKGAV